MVTFVFPQEQDVSRGKQGYHVKLTYVDSDEDCVTIGSSDELLDAIEQFSDKGGLRILAEIKQLQKALSTTPQFFRGDSLISKLNSAPEIPIKKLLEGFVGVLTNAVVALQEVLAAPTSTHTAREDGDSTLHVSSRSSKLNNRSAGQQVVAGASKVGGTTTSTKKPIDETGIRQFFHGRHTCGKSTNLVCNLI